MRTLTLIPPGFHTGRDNVSLPTMVAGLSWLRQRPTTNTSLAQNFQSCQVHSAKTPTVLCNCLLNKQH